MFKKTPAVVATVLPLLICCRPPIDVVDVNSNPLLLAIVEQGRLTSIVGGQPHEAPFRRVRIAFRSDQAGWHPAAARPTTETELAALAQAYPTRMTWTVGASGTPVHFDTARPPVVPSYAAAGIQDLISGAADIPTGLPTREFAGWPDEVRYPPLVAISGSRDPRPSRWRPAESAPDRVFAAALSQFRMAIGSVVACLPGQDDPKPYAFSADDPVFRRTYASPDQEFLLGLGLDPQAYNCDGPPPARQWDPHWFLVTSDGTVRDLGFGLHMVGASDYDLDGLEEVVFFRAAYNQDAYVIFSSDFRNRTEFAWNYH